MLSCDEETQLGIDTSLCIVTHMQITSINNHLHLVLFHCVIVHSMQLNCIPQRMFEGVGRLLM